MNCQVHGFSVILLSYGKYCDIIKKGGNIAGDTRKAIEDSTGKPVITSKNAAELNTVVTNLIEGIAEDTDKE